MVGMRRSLRPLPTQAIWDSIKLILDTTDPAQEGGKCADPRTGLFLPTFSIFCFVLVQGDCCTLFDPDGNTATEARKDLSLQRASGSSPALLTPNPIPCLKARLKSSNLSYNFKARLRWHKSHLRQLSQGSPSPSSPGHTTPAHASLALGGFLPLSPADQQQRQTNTCIGKDLAFEVLSLQSHPQ